MVGVYKKGFVVLNISKKVKMDMNKVKIVSLVGDSSW
jgi:hypothetical protein